MAAKTAAEDQLVDGVVQRGTVVWGTPDSPIHSGVGEKVQVSAGEAEALKRRGILVDDRNGPPPLGIGPNYGLDSEDGPVTPSALDKPV
jgi:hypothetical protein